MTPEQKICDFLFWVKTPFTKFTQEGVRVDAQPKEIARKLLNTFTWQPRQGMSESQALEKMVKNAKKAQAITIEKHPNDKACLASLEQLDLFLKKSEKLEKPLIVTKLESTKKATNPMKKNSENEDVTFFLKEGDYVLAGLCDGHGGIKVADAVRQRFEEQFSDDLNSCKHPFEAFEMFIRETETMIHSNKQLDGQGATVLACLINSKTGEMITMSVGDSAAMSFMQIGKEWKAIRHNVERDWTTPKEALKAAYIKNAPEIVNLWPKNDKPEHLRFPDKNCGLNLTRSIGDKRIKELNTIKIDGQTVYGIGLKPTLSVTYLKPGIQVVICSDGVDRFVNASEMIDILKDPSKDSSLELVTYAQSTKKSYDDVTALVLDVQ